MMLLEYTNVNAQINPNGWTILHEVVSDFVQLSEDVSMKIISKIVQKGANVNAVCNKGQNVLHIATEQDNDLVAMYLFTKGASATLADKDGNTALSLAKDNENDELLSFFEERASGPRTATTDVLVPLFVRFVQCVLDGIESDYEDWLVDNPPCTGGPDNISEATAGAHNFAAFAISLCPPIDQRGDVDAWRLSLSLLYNKDKHNTFLGDDSCLNTFDGDDFSPPPLSGEERAWIDPFLDVLTSEMVQKYEAVHAGASLDTYEWRHGLKKMTKFQKMVADTRDTTEYYTKTLTELMNTLNV